MKIHQQMITLPQRQRGFHLITREIVNSLRGLHEIETGMCQVFIQHTSASLTINENADATVRKDFETYFNKAVPENDPDYLHNDEGPDDMPAHIRTMLTAVSLQVPVLNARLALGTWQAIYLIEHRRRPHRREVVLQVMGNQLGNSR